MVKLILLLGIVLAAFVAESSCQRIIRRPIRRRIIIIRRIREAGDEKPQLIFKDDDITHAPASGDHQFFPSIIDDIKLDPHRRMAREAKIDEPLWLFKDDQIPRAPASSDHPFLPSIIDDFKQDPNRRTARSVDSSSSGSTAMGATPPGYNHRNAREIRLPLPYVPSFPTPTRPNPFKFDLYHPFRTPYSIHARSTRDIHLPGAQKPSHRDVIIPNWNPNVRTNPWQRFGVKPRNPRSADRDDYEQEEYLVEV